MGEDIPMLGSELKTSLCSGNLYAELLYAFEISDLAKFERILSNSEIDVDYRYGDPKYGTLLDLCAMRGNCGDQIKILLNHGANQNLINPERKKAPIHFAARNSDIETFRILVEHPRTNLNILDNYGNTALHYAVKHPDSVTAVQLLINKTANLNVINRKGKTPLCIAMDQSNEEVMKLLIDSGADLTIEGLDGTTIMEDLKKSFPHINLPNTNVQQDFDKKSEMSHSELFYLLRQRRFNEFLTGIKANKHFLEKSDGCHTFLQYCCAFNLENIVKVLLDLGANPNTTHDALKDTPIMLAARKGNANIVKMLIEWNGDLDLSAVNGETALHSVVEGVQSIVQDDVNYLECMKLLLTKVPKSKLNINQQDFRGNTVLHYAAKMRQHDMVLLLLKHGAYIGMENSIQEAAGADISYNTFLQHLDSCVSTNDVLPREENYEITFNYDFLLPIHWTQNEKSCKDVENNLPRTQFLRSETKPLLHIANNRELRSLLKHPIFTSFLHLKWYKIRYLFYINLLFYLLFWLFLTIYILNDYSFYRNYNLTKTLIDGNTNYNSKYNPNWFIVSSLLSLLILREIFQFYLGPKKYLSNSENWLEICLIIVAIIILCFDNINIVNKHQLSAICIMLSWAELVLLIGRHPALSINIEMLKTVTLNFLTFLAWYSILIIAFALSFYTLFKDTKYDDNEENYFYNPGISIFKTIVMLTGEFDAGTIPFLEYPIISHVLFVLFVFLIAIVLFNLLNGLAVSDTQAIRSDAELVSIISRAKLIIYLENILINPRKLLLLLKLFNFTKYFSINLTDTLTSDHKIHVLVNKNSELTIESINSDNAITKSQSCTRTLMKVYMDHIIVDKAAHILINKQKKLEQDNEKSKQLRLFNDMENCKQDLEDVKAMLKELLMRMSEKQRIEK